MEQYRLLPDNRYAVIGAGICAKRHSVNFDTAASYVIVTKQQVDGGGFPPSAGAFEEIAPAFLRLKVEVKFFSTGFLISKPLNQSLTFAKFALTAFGYAFCAFCNRFSISLGT